MKKIYFVFMLLASAIGTNLNAQIIAVNDVTAPINPSYQFYVTNILLNDVLNGETSPNPITEVTLSILDNPEPGITIEYGIVYVAQSVASGSYEILYQICEIANPANCSTAIATVNVCSIGAPVVENIINPTCDTEVATVSISNLPAGAWTLEFDNTFIAGSGTTYTLVVAGMGTTDSWGHYLTVTDANGCTSGITNFNIVPAYQFYLNFSEGTHNDLNGDGYLSPVDLMNFNIWVVNSGNCDLSGFTLQQSSGDFMIDGDLYSLTVPAGDSVAVAAHKIIDQEFINDHTAWVFLHIQTLSQAGNPIQAATEGALVLDIPDRIRLHAFADINANGSFDSEDYYLSGAQFEYEVNNDGTIHTISPYSGSAVLYENNPANTYDISVNLPANLQANYVNAPVLTDISVPQGSGITEYYFPFTYIPAQNISVYMTPVGGTVPGTTFQLHITVIFYGTDTTTGTLNVLVDPALDVLSVSPQGTITTDGFTADYTIATGESQTFVAVISTPALPAVELGQLVHFTAQTTVPTGDSWPENNTVTTTLPVMGSYDPNDKMESHGREIRFDDFGTDDYLTYTIRFENTGNANANNVRIEDVLNDQLDATTLRTVAASHNNVMERTGENVIWRFNNIQLPPSVMNTSIGHCFVQFQVKPKPGFTVGDIIPNTAEIYFDTNPAIVTNTFETEFVEELGVADVATNILRIFPNPTNGNLNVSATNIEKVSVFDVSGKFILEEIIGADEARIDVSGLTSGVHLIKIKTTNKLETKRFIKQ